LSISIEDCPGSKDDRAGWSEKRKRAVLDWGGQRAGAELLLHALQGAFSFRVVLPDAIGDGQCERRPNDDPRSCRMKPVRHEQQREE
jgi:hypothetical protein